MTQKRIKAEKYDRHIAQGVFSKGHLPSTKWEAVYLIRQSDIRALAEQMADEHVDFWNQSQDPYRNTVNIMLRVLKRHGMTPGRKDKLEGRES